MYEKEYSDTTEKGKYETLIYQPGLQDSGDLENDIRTITNTLEATGLVNADYQVSLTIPKPEDVRLLIKRICARLEVTIDAIPAVNTALYCRVYVDVQNTDHRLFDLNWTSAGNKLTAVDTCSGERIDIFDLLRDGTAHTFYFFFWRTGAGDGISISTVRLWEGIGSHIVGAGTPCLGIVHTGFLSGFIACGNVGSGNPILRLCQGIQDDTYLWYIVSANIEVTVPLIIGENFGIAVNATLNTDFTFLIRAIFILKTN